MFCGKCGFELEDGSLFCGNCGSAVHNPENDGAGQGFGAPGETIDLGNAPASAFTDDARDAAAAIGSLDPGDGFRPVGSSAANTTVYLGAQEDAWQGQAGTAPTYAAAPAPAAASMQPAAAKGGGSKNRLVVIIAASIAAAAAAFALVWFFMHGGPSMFSGGSENVAQTESAQSGTPSGDGQGSAPTATDSKSDDSTSQAEKDKAKAEKEKAEAEAEKAKAEAEKAKAEAEKAKAEAEAEKKKSKNSSNSNSTSSNSKNSSSSGYILSDSNSRYYSRSQLESMSLKDLYLARNEIYARHGRGFNNDELQSYFNSKSWYTRRYSAEDFDAMPSPLNDYEQKNADLMLKVEEDANSPYLSKTNRPSIF